LNIGGLIQQSDERGPMPSGVMGGRSKLQLHVRMKKQKKKTKIYIKNYLKKTKNKKT
jgi:hypothetical protein